MWVSQMHEGPQAPQVGFHMQLVALCIWADSSVCSCNHLSGVRLTLAVAAHRVVMAFVLPSCPGCRVWR